MLLNKETKSNHHDNDAFMLEGVKDSVDVFI